MIKRLYFYVVVANSIFLKGIENLIKTTICDKATIDCKERLDLLLDKRIIPSSDNYMPILIYDVDRFLNDDFNHLLQLTTWHPGLKILIITSKVRVSDIKLLFEIGVAGIINTTTSQEMFTDYVLQIIQGETVVSQDFCNMIVDHFCHASAKAGHIPGKGTIEEEEALHADLTHREKEILGFICDGKSTREISEQLFLSQHTVETHRRRILNKLGVKNTASMVKSAIKSKLYFI